MTGALLTGLFASKAVNSAGANGLLFGNPAQLGIQAVAVAVTLVYCAVGAFIILKSSMRWLACGSQRKTKPLDSISRSTGRTRIPSKAGMALQRYTSGIKRQLTSH